MERGRNSVDSSDIDDLVRRQIASTGVKYIMDLIRGLTPTAQYEKARREMLDDLITDTAGMLDKLTARVGTLEASVTEEHFRAALNRLLPETFTSLTRERRRLMAAALAGVVAPDLSVEQKSRVIRAIASLEPSDVIHLRLFEEVHRSGDEKGTRTPHAVRERWTTSGRGQSYEVFALESAGCLVFRPQNIIGQKGGHELTQLGRDVLRYIQDWEPEQGPAK